MRIITTADGSHTLFSDEFNEIYHSQHGAIQESQHVFIQHGLEYVLSLGLVQPIHIFEVGFGTGLNALLTLIKAIELNVKVYYETVELCPVPLEVIKELNYTQLLQNEKYRPPFHSMHLSTWGTENIITPNFTLKKINVSLAEYPKNRSFNLIYFDAFAPQYQPEMWTEEVFAKMNSLLNTGGVLVSYCAQSFFQKTLKQCGFKVEKLAGPPGKREMVRAIKL